MMLWLRTMPVKSLPYTTQERFISGTATLQEFLITLMPTTTLLIPVMVKQHPDHIILALSAGVLEPLVAMFVSIVNSYSTSMTSGPLVTSTWMRSPELVTAAIADIMPDKPSILIMVETAFSCLNVGNMEEQSPWMKETISIVASTYNHWNNNKEVPYCFHFLSNRSAEKW